MSPKDLFLAALDQPAEARAAFLAALDPQMRARVEQLLAAHEAANDFLNPSLGPPVATLDSAGGEEPLAATLRLGTGPREGLVIADRYKLEKLLGEGGMGEVWVAQQTEPVSRRVAIKLMKPGMDSRAFLTRFEAERQALALMDHPSIARVLDGGLTPDHRPYYVMELVQGHSLTEYCDHAKLTPRQRLELFIPICQAVQHAHQKGIVHRDLKPNNILVTTIDGRPVPKVIDFGVAKATGGRLTDESLHTDFGVIVGTLEYMSPEQAGTTGQDIDTRADIYSLGVILYELLTGLRPIDAKRLKKAALTEMVRIIREEEPSKPSTRLSTAEGLPSLAALRQTEPRKLMALLRGDLDWVVMKCLEKDRGRRYETANGLARDIQRYLADEAVDARPPSLGYRAGKFLKRHRGAVAAAALVLLALVAGVIGTTWGMLDAQRARAAEADRAEGERLAKLDAQKRLQQVEAGNAVLTSIFEDLNVRKLKEGNEPLEAALARRLLKAAHQLDGDSAGDPLLVAGLQEKLGLSLHSLGFASEAKELFAKARATRQAKLGTDHPDTLVSRSNLAASLTRAGQLELATPLLEETWELMKQKLGKEHPQTLGCESCLANAYQDAGKLNLALPLHEEVLRLRRTVLGPDAPDTLVSINNLVDCRRALGQIGQVLPLLEEVCDRQRSKLGPDHPDTLLSQHNLGGAYLEAGKPDLALPLMAETVRRRRERLGPDHPDTFASLCNLAEGYRTAGKLDLAMPLLEENYRQMKAKLGPDHPYTLTTLSNLASGYRDLGRLPDALRLREEAYELMKTKLGADHPTTLVVQANLATAYKESGQLDRALPHWQESLKLKQAKLGADHPSTLMSMNHVAEGYMLMARHADAIDLYEQTLAGRKAKLGAEHPDTVISMNNLGNAYREAGRVDRALPLFEAALPLMKAKLGADHLDTLTCMNNLALAYHGTGKLDQALPLYEETLRLRKAKVGPDHPDTLASMHNLAVAYWLAKRPEPALALLEETLRRSQNALGREHVHTLRTGANLGAMYRDLGRTAEALPLVEAAYQAATRQPSLRFTGPILFELYLKVGDNPKAAAVARELLATARTQLPKDSPQLASALAVAALGLLQAEAYADAEAALRECLTIREKSQPTHWSTSNTQSMLGHALLGQKKYADAEPLLLKGYQGLKEQEKSIPAEARVLRLREAVQRLVDLYEATSKPAEAARWKKELNALPAPLPKPETKP